ncbi:hypothetical protein A0J61_08562 [Choanephora cucurbitarum]|uniref:Uncharacterized protein n=1 Tax=Choanephora cucurbitarum TaxID=101091 RepID=A0A1C7N300_9FUNG|nr:hypothetical protein A0J61_08562 [Choanephora cucurbitarum]
MYRKLELGYYSDNLAMDYVYILQLTELYSCEPVLHQNLKTDRGANNSRTNNRRNYYRISMVRSRFVLLLSLFGEEELSVSKATKQCIIPRSSAYLLLKEFNAGGGNALPGKALKKKKKRANKGTLVKVLPEHAEFLVKHFDSNPSSTLEMAK